MSRRLYSFVVIIFGLTLAACQNDGAIKPSSPHSERPNIIIIYVDDLGYGDLSSYGAIGVKTPNVDKMAEGGVRFTDAHSSSATCTPSRYSLLTGEYAFRNNARVLPGDAGALIKPGKPTLPAMLQQAGYKTGVVGKWHLGLGDGGVDWNEDVKPGPLEIGFDYSFLLPATGDRVPTVYLEGHSVIGADPKDPIIVDYKKKVGDRPTGLESPELLRYPADPGHSKTIVNGVSRIGYMGGGEAALWVDEDFPDVFSEKAIRFIRDNKANPFFLYYSFHDIHVPRLPHPRFQGKSMMGPRGDAIVQMDWMTGKIMDELDALGLSQNTLIIFTSDNGPVLNDGYEDKAVELLGAHKPAGPYRGSKYSIYEAGTRVPMIAYWPGRVEKSTSSALISQTDFYASLADMVGVKIQDGEAVDSENVLPALLGETQNARAILFYEGVATVALRDGDWKYIPPAKRNKKDPKFLKRKGLESGLSYEAQLYNLLADPSETKNIANAHPDKVAMMQMELNKVLQTQTE